MSEICILYCLTKREMTIYSVKKHISEYFGAFTNPSHGTIHPCMKKLLGYGFLNVNDILSEGGKKSSYYSITDKGRTYFADLMMSDFSENPSVFLGEINTRIAAMGALPNKDKEDFRQHCLHALELYEVSTNNLINDEYTGLDDFQKATAKLSVENTKAIANFLTYLKV